MTSPKAANALPASYEGTWVRLRPVSHQDHPLIFALRIQASGAEWQDAIVPAPTFDDWESRELADILAAGPSFVVETADSRFCGVVRLSRLNLRDGWGYLSVRLYPELLQTTVSLEALRTFVAFAFDRFNLRKLYAENTPAQDLVMADMARVGFREELRLKDRVWCSGRFVDLVYMALTRAHWSTTAAAMAAQTLAFSTMIAEGAARQP